MKLALICSGKPDGLKYLNNNRQKLESSLREHGWEIISMPLQNMGALNISLVEYESKDIAEFIFFYTGHGDTSNDDGVLTLKLHDNSEMDINSLQRVIDKINPRKKAIVLDACYSSGVIKDTNFKDGTEFLCSSKSISQSFEDESLESSIFSHHFSEALKVEGDVTFESIRDYINLKTDKQKASYISVDSKIIFSNQQATKVTSSKQKLFHVPFTSKAEGAIGIDDKLKEVHKELSQSKKTVIGQVASFEGIGGLGKTQLAVEYAYRYKDEYDGVVWLTMDQDLDEQFLDLAEKSKWVDINVDINVKLEKAEKGYSSLENTLLIYDNVETYEELEPYFPKSNTNKTLITSRNAIQDVTTISLNTLNEDNSLKLLEHESNNKITDEMLPYTKELVEILDGLPLALEMAGALVYNLGLTWHEYLELFKKDGISLLEQSKIRRSYTKHENNIDKTLSLSAGLLEDTEGLEDILNILAWGATDAIDKELISFMLSKDALTLTIPIKMGLKLKFIKQDEDGYTLHRLVREVWKKQRELNSKFATEVGKNLSKYMKEIKDEFLNLRKLERASIQALSWAGKLDDRDIKAALVNYAAYPDYHMGRYKDALEKVDKVFCLFDKESDTKIYAELLNSKGLFHHSLGESNAKPYFIQALEMRQRFYPDNNHSDVARSLNNVGSFLKALGKSKEAKLYFIQALKMMERLYPDSDHPDVASSLNNVGAVLYTLKKLDEAKDHFIQALNMRKILYPDSDHPDVATSLNNVGSVLQSLEESKEAKPYFIQALDMRQRLYQDSDHPDVASSLNSVGTVYVNLKECKKAEELLSKAVEMYKRLDYDKKGLYDANGWLNKVRFNIKKEKKYRRGKLCIDL